MVGDGTYTAGLASTSRIGAGDLYITGNPTTPANVYIDIASGSVFSFSGHPAGSNIYLDGFKLDTASGAADIYSDRGSVVWLSNIVYAGNPTYHVYIQQGGAIVILGDYEIISGAAAHWHVDITSFLYAELPVTGTLTGTPNFTGAFAQSSLGGIITTNTSHSFSGLATGSRYSATVNGIINTFGAGATFLPGDAGGSTATGGQYI
jgi:hypothetical protein